MGIFGHPGKVGVEQPFATVDEVDIEDEFARFVDNFLEKPEIHEPLFFFLQVFIGAHDTAQVANARCLDPEADREIDKYGLLPFVGEKNPPQSPVIGNPAHALAFFAGIIIKLFIPLFGASINLERNEDAHKNGTVLSGESSPFF
jgi:hypothetical protein